MESYVLGLASEDERAEFEKLCTQYPELVEARTSFELLLEKAAMENAVEPPVNSKEKIWTALQQTSASNTPKIITMEPTTRKSSGPRWLAAASIILLLAAAYFAYNFYNENKTLEGEKKDMADKLNEAERARDSTKRMLDDIIGGQNVTLVTMKSMAPAAPVANVYWDSTSANVYLVVKNISKLASDQQYQLWSLLDGKPTSLGVFGDEKEKLVLRMDNAQKADAFAITIEPKGNPGGPHLENLQTMGETRKKL